MFSTPYQVFHTVGVACEGVTSVTRPNVGVACEGVTGVTRPNVGVACKMS